MNEGYLMEKNINYDKFLSMLKCPPLNLSDFNFCDLQELLEASNTTYHTIQGNYGKP